MSKQEILKKKKRFLSKGEIHQKTVSQLKFLSFDKQYLFVE